MSAVEVAGWAAMLSTFVFFSIASPTQIRKHHKEKKVGLTGFYAAWPGVSHILWLVYGLYKHDPFLVYVNIFAVIMVGIICYQKFWKYRGK